MREARSEEITRVSKRSTSIAACPPNTNPKISMATKLIADAGGTKTDWLLLDAGRVKKHFCTDGINPSLSDINSIVSMLGRDLQSSLNSARVDAVRFYGAGCRGDAADRMRQALADLLKVDDIVVASDLYGAARILCGHRHGIVCLLGTGSNSGLYDGETIIKSVPPLGYILGDEGSGAVMGRKLIANIYKGQFSEEIRQAFHRDHPYSQDEIIAAVYRGPQPNRFLAGFTHFISKNMHLPEMQSFVEQEFREYILRNIVPYAHQDWPLYCVGSIAEVFSDSLRKVCEEHGYHVREIWKRPLDKLLSENS